MSFKEPFHYSMFAIEVYSICICILLLGYHTPYFSHVLIAVLSIMVGVLYFFRKHIRPFDRDRRIVCSPCEGTILRVDEHPHHIHISTFLNLHNIHIQYLPYDGVIIDKQYKKGAFHPAHLFTKSQHNERLITTLDTSIGHMYIIQYAGLIARRIIDFQPVHVPLQKGDPLGLIKFGSRVDIYIPKKYISKVLVQSGDAISIGDALCYIDQDDTCRT